MMIIVTRGEAGGEKQETLKETESGNFIMHRGTTVDIFCTKVRKYYGYIIINNRNIHIEKCCS